MSFAGHVLDMINTTRQNRALLTSKRERIARVRQQYVESLHHETRRVADHEISPEIMEKIKCEIRNNIRKRKLKMWFFAIPVILVIVCGISVLIALVINNIG